MNELEFLRSQLQLEQANLARSCDILARAARHAGTEGPAPSPASTAVQAANAHVEFALRRELQRARTHARLLSDHIARGSVGATELDGLRAATAVLQAALDEAPALAPQQCADRLRTAGAPLEPWCARLYSLSDWRRAAQIDAEAVFEDRRLHEAAIAAARSAGLLG